MRPLIRKPKNNRDGSRGYTSGGGLHSAVSQLGISFFPPRVLDRIDGGVFRSTQLQPRKDSPEQEPRTVCPDLRLWPMQILLSLAPSWKKKDYWMSHWPWRQLLQLRL